MDGLLVERARRGDRAAYETLARAMAPRLYGVALRMLRDKDAADDALQQTLVAIWRELPGLRDASSFEAWSNRILARLCLNDLKARRRRVAITDPAMPPAQHENGIELVHVRDQLQRALRRLSPKHQAVLMLVYYHDLNAGDAASALGIPVGTVASRLHHARRELRAALDAEARQTAPLTLG
jgi:RNA polymerase sigma-70 factor, ECF subfamily